MEVDKLLERIDVKIDRLDARLDGLEVTLGVQGQVLEEHMRRTQLAEEMIQTVKAELKPVTTHIAVIGGLAKVVVFAGTLVGIVTGLLKLLGH